MQQCANEINLIGMNFNFESDELLCLIEEADNQLSNFQRLQFCTAFDYYNAFLLSMTIKDLQSAFCEGFVSYVSKNLKNSEVELYKEKYKKATRNYIDSYKKYQKEISLLFSVEKRDQVAKRVLDEADEKAINILEEAEVVRADIYVQKAANAEPDEIFKNCEKIDKIKENARVVRCEGGRRLKILMNPGYVNPFNDIACSLNEIFKLCRRRGKYGIDVFDATPSSSNKVKKLATTFHEAFVELKFAVFWAEVIYSYCTTNNTMLYPGDVSHLYFQHMVPGGFLNTKKYKLSTLSGFARLLKCLNTADVSVYTFSLKIKNTSRPTPLFVSYLKGIKNNPS